MLDVDVLGYDIEKIAKSKKFYNALVKCAEITNPDKFGNSRESSMAVNGYIGNYDITKPQKEEPTKALAGNHRGVNYTQDGFGLYKPEEAFRILNIHFHPTDSLAIPSEADMYELPETSKESIIKGLYIPRKVEMIGHKEKGITTLFLKQFTGSLTESDERFGIVYTGMEKMLLDTSNKVKSELCQVASNFLNKSKFYKSRVISFKDIDEYMEQSHVFKYFEILEVIEDIDLENLETDEVFDNKRLNRYFDEIEEENFRENYGVFSEDEDHFVNIDDFDF